MKKRRPPLPPFVVEYEVPKGSGKWFVYFRQKGQKNVRMRGTPGTDEWETLYRRLLTGYRPEVKTTVHHPVKDTFAWLCQQYMSSPEFGQLNERTKRVRRGILSGCVNERPQGETRSFGEVPLTHFRPTTVAKLRDRKRETPEAANGRVKAIRAVFSWACSPEMNLVQVNPARDVKYFKSNNPEGHHTWSIEEIEQFEKVHPLGTKAHLAMALLLYTGQRRGDVVQLGRQHEKDGWLKLTQQKNRERRPVHLEIPIRPELKTVLDASPTGDLVYLVTEFNQPFSDNGFGNWFRDRCIEAGVPGRAHGLRKACATRLADNGATPHEIMAITGHKTMKEVLRYTQAADQKRLAESAYKR